MIAVNLVSSNSGPEVFSRIVSQPLIMQINNVTSAKILFICKTLLITLKTSFVLLQLRLRLTFKLRRLHVLRSQRISEVQWAHLTALRGIGVKQYGQSLVEAAGAGLGVCIRLICLTIRKTAKAMMMKFKMVLMKMP